MKYELKYKNKYLLKTIKMQKIIKLYNISAIITGKL